MICRLEGHEASVLGQLSCTQSILGQKEFSNKRPVRGSERNSGSLQGIFTGADSGLPFLEDSMAKGPKYLFHRVVAVKRLERLG